MIDTYIVNPDNDLTNNEIDQAISIMLATLNYGPPQLRTTTEDGRTLLSGIHKFTTKSESHAALLKAAFEQQLPTTFTITQQDYAAGSVRWSNDPTV